MWAGMLCAIAKRLKEAGEEKEIKAKKGET